MESARGNEQDVVGFDGTVLGADSRAFDQWQQVALNTLAGNVASSGIRASTDFVDLIEEHDAVLFDRFKRGFVDGFVVQ